MAALQTRMASRPTRQSRDVDVTSDSFELHCDKLSMAVDSALFERLRWDRTEAPMLERLVALAHGALESRSDFELTEEGATVSVKRFILKVHTFRVMAIVIYLEGSRVHITAETGERGRYRIAELPPLTADFAAVDEQWMAAALQELFGRIQA